MCKKGENEMAAIAEKKLVELRRKIQQMNKDIPVIKDGKKGAIQLDPNNPSHKEWYEGR